MHSGFPATLEYPSAEQIRWQAHLHALDRADLRRHWHCAGMLRLSGPHAGPQHGRLAQSAAVGVFASEFATSKAQHLSPE